MTKPNADSQVTTLDDAPPVVTAAPAPKVAAAAKAAPPSAAAADAAPVAMFTVTVHATGDDNGNDVVEIQPNGKLYRLPRGVPCLVPHEVLHILQNAVYTTYRNEGAAVIQRDIPRYPFSAVPA
ncbi:hypothetical protein [Polaromonas sp. CG9_12]|nr:hypothetical protein [Polaromonas sp. CG9_12]